MGYYRLHLFFCTNVRDSGNYCAKHNAEFLCDYVKKRLKSLNLHGAGNIRVSSSGCMGRCKLGPVLVIYPSNIWYSYKSQNDLDLIIENHLINGQVVKELLLSS